MNKSDALKFAIEGRRVRDKHWVPGAYIQWDRSKFTSGGTSTSAEVLLENSFNDYWEIYTEKVDTIDATDAFRAGKRIRSVRSGEVYQLKADPNPKVTLDEASGRWEVLD